MFDIFKLSLEIFDSGNNDAVQPFAMKFISWEPVGGWLDLEVLLAMSMMSNDIVGPGPGDIFSSVTVKLMPSFMLHVKCHDLDL